MADVSFKPISKLLIANRGEIARRIIRSAQDMGISTVAVYADSDATAPFVSDADTAIALDGQSPAETYLQIDKVLEACQRTGADADRQVAHLPVVHSVSNAVAPGGVGQGQQ